MSSILKALRRLEEERARKSSVAPEIAANLLRSRSQRRQAPLWLWPIVIVIVAVAIASLFWSLRPTPVMSDRPRSTLAPAPFSEPLPHVVTPRSGGGVIIEEVIDQRRPALLPPTPPIGPAAEMILPAQPVPVSAKAEEPVTTPVTTPAAVQPLIEERQSPVVSAIAWQEESSARMAVVDGLPVMTGEVIGTAKIQEILPDRILFNAGGVLFIVRMQ